VTVSLTGYHTKTKEVVQKEDLTTKLPAAGRVLKEYAKGAKDYTLIYNS
jgi:hypothetical protein